MQKKLFNKLNGGGAAFLSGKNNRFFKLFNIVFLSAAMLCGAVFGLGAKFQSPAFPAEAASSLASTDMWNSSDKAFDYDVVEQFYA